MIVNKKAAAKPAQAADPQVAIANARPKINMYDQPPQNVVTLHEFHSMALNRLQVLRKIEFM